MAITSLGLSFFAANRASRAEPIETAYSDERQPTMVILSMLAINFAKKSDLEPPPIRISLSGLELFANKASSPSARENQMLSKKARVISSVTVA